MGIIQTLSKLQKVASAFLTCGNLGFGVWKKLFYVTKTQK